MSAIYSSIASKDAKSGANLPFGWWRICATTQRETKRLPDADAEEKTELILPFQDDGWGAKIKSYRKKHGLTQKKLAAQIGVKHFTLRSWEQGKTKPPYEIWRQYEHLFDETIDFPRF